MATIEVSRIIELNPVQWWAGLRQAERRFLIGIIVVEVIFMTSLGVLLVAISAWLGLQPWLGWLALAWVAPFLLYIGLVRAGKLPPLPGPKTSRAERLRRATDALVVLGGLIIFYIVFFI